MQETKYIWMDGELVPWAEAKVHVLTHGLHYGTGVFEGIRAYLTQQGTAVFRLTDHLERMARSAHIYSMSLPFTVTEMAKATKDLIKANELEACYIRPIAFLGYGEMGLNPLKCTTNVAIAVWPWGAYLGDEGVRNGVRTKVSSWRRLDNNIMPPAAKASGNYLNSILAKMEAVQGGYDEAIMLNPDGYLTDGSGENLFLIRDGVVHTPPCALGPLEGITRRSVTQIARDSGYEVREAVLTRTDLYVADELFFTGTAAEVVPIREVDDRTVGSGKPGPITKDIQESFFAAVHGEIERYREWLEPV